MIATKIELGGSYAISAPSLLLLLLLLLPPLKGIGSGGVLSLEEESGLMMDGIPAEHRDRLELLTTVLAMDTEWSAVWSETLKPDVVEDAGLVKEFCPSLPEIKGNINAIDFVKNVMTHCSHSGMYVEFAVYIVAVSAQCLFSRHAKLQLDAIQSIPHSAINEYALHLKGLEEDFQIIANLLATFDADLVPLIAVAKFFSEVRTKWVTYGEENKKSKMYQNEIKRKAFKLSDYLDTKNDYCAEYPTHWYDQDKKNIVTLNVADIERSPESDGSSTSTTEGSTLPKQPVVRKAHQLRMLFLEEFKKLLLGKLPPNVWKLMFENNILVRPIETKMPKGLISKLNDNLKKIGNKFRRK